MKPINQNPNFGFHNTSSRNESIKYLVIHYVGATGGAKANIDYYNQPTTNFASADFYVGFDGEIWQYNPDPSKRYCWAVGGKRQSSFGGSFYGEAKNSNCISIELCVRNNSTNKNANTKGWYFEKATINSGVELAQYLMKKYNIPINRVIRHFDVNGKYCPGVIGWNSAPGNNESEWINFKNRIAGKTSATSTISNTQGGTTYMFSVKQIKKGDQGVDVLLAQEILKARGLYTGELDRAFGPLMDAAVKKYQQQRKLGVDGIIGPQTWKDLLGM